MPKAVPALEESDVARLLLAAVTIRRDPIIFNGPRLVSLAHFRGVIRLRKCAFCELRSRNVGGVLSWHDELIRKARASQQRLLMMVLCEAERERWKVVAGVWQASVQ